MKKNWWFFLFLGLFFSLHLPVYAETTTCSGGTPAMPAEDKARLKVESAKIDYQIDPSGLREELIKEIGDSIGSVSKEKAGWLVYTILPDLFARSDENIVAIPVSKDTQNILINANILMDTNLMKKYGGYFSETIKKFPQLVDAIKTVKKDFKPEDLGTAFPNKAYEMGDGRILMIFGGCTPHDCAGTENRIAYDQQNNKIYVLVENADQSKVYLYGNPDNDVQQLMLYNYLYQ